MGKTIISENHFPLSLPVIDFTSRDLKTKTKEWDSVRGQVRKALEEYGCFEALFDGVSLDLRKGVFEESEKFFDLPMETKLSTKSEPSYKGYVSDIPTMPLYESIGIDDNADNPQVFNDLIHKLWSQGNITFSKKVHSFTEKLKELDVMVRRMIMESFGLENYIEEHLNSAKNIVRLLKYRGVDDNAVEKLGHIPHIDRNLLTIICQNDEVDGLEIKTKDGDEWIKAKPSQDTSFLVIAGASLHVLLNGRVFPPLHRVIRTGNKDRYTAGLFVIPKEGFIINSPEELVDDEHPRLYKPFDFEDYFKFTNISTKKRDLSTLKTYCGL